MSDPGPTTGVYTISVAAELAGVTVRSLRLYERHRLIRPGRTTGGTRRYSQDDLHRIRRITELIADGVNLTGIGKILDLEQDTHELRADNIALRADNGRLRADLASDPDRNVPGRAANRPGGGYRPAGLRPMGTATSPPDRADASAISGTDKRHHEHATIPAGQSKG